MARESSAPSVHCRTERQARAAAVAALSRRFATSELSVLALGEIGDGKENAAAALHHRSARVRRPMIGAGAANSSERFRTRRRRVGGAPGARAPPPGAAQEKTPDDR
ncbi:sigma 54-interacting transcriptional regulator [Sorangium sp. So ce448]|uniref:sigma 54-interacting transcriptional regulator n=1 Tax=Sorangium sp. So ce448 TaxID=3133314 RepID=UPI003F623E37